MSKIGVFVCWCGRNIAGTVDVKAVSDVLKNHPGVAHAEDYTYMCSDPGQKLLQEAVREKGLTGIVVAACSPQLHEPTFRKASKGAGLNPYLCEMANIREHCSWVHSDQKEAATLKAIELTRLTVEKAKRNRPLVPARIPVTRRAMVLGAGIAGMQAALDVAKGGYDVVVVERSPAVGGRVGQLHATFPRLENVQYLTRPKTARLLHDPHVALHTNSELVELTGYVGNFKARIRTNPTFVDRDRCDLCGKCLDACPVEVSEPPGVSVRTRKAIYVPIGGDELTRPVVDAAHCTHFGAEGCTKCADVCEPKAIDFTQKPKEFEESVGAVVAATGFDLYPLSEVSEYGSGAYPDVLTSFQFEQLLRSSEGGELRRPSDGKVPKEVVFIQCVRSRDRERGVPYCSKICCMYTAKQATLYKQRVPDGQAYIFYMDVRVSGKEYEDFIRRAVEEYGVMYLRGRVSKVAPEGDGLVVWGADTLSGKSVEIQADAVVLATALVANAGSTDLAKRLGIPYDPFGFFSEAHPKLRPVETNTAGIFLAGACQAPKDIAETVAQASGAASKVLGLFSAEELEREPEIAAVDESVCVGCFDCVKVCTYRAIGPKEIRDRKGDLVKVVASVNQGLCQGCGLCVATCRSKCLDLDGFTEEQVFAEIASL